MADDIAPEGAQDTLSTATGGVDFSSHPAEVSPYNQLSAARIGDHAGLDINPTIAQGPEPEVKPAENVPDNLRYQYSRALMAGETDGPGDFSERVAGVGVGVSGGSPDPSDAARVANGAQSLAAALPSHEDLIDHSAAIAHDVYGEAAPGAVAVVKQNLLDAWTKTGIPLDMLAAQANVDSDFKQALAMPPKAPASASPYFPNQGVPAFDTQHADGMIKGANVDPWNRQALQNSDGSYSTTSSITIGTDAGEVVIPTVINGKRLSDDDAVDHYHQTGEQLGTFSDPDKAEAYATALHNAQAGQRDEHGNIKPLINPIDFAASEDQVMKPGEFATALGQQLTSDDPTGLRGLAGFLGIPDIHADQQEYDKRVAERQKELVEGGMSETSAMLNASADMGIPPYAQAFGVGNIETVGASVPAITTISAGLSKFWPTLFSRAGEEGGTAQGLAADARALFRQAGGRVQQASDELGAILEGFRPKVADLVPAHEEAIAQWAQYAEAHTNAAEQWAAEGNTGLMPADRVPLPRPAIDPLMAFWDHFEDRPGGARLEQSDPLFGLAEYGASINKTIRAEFEARGYDTEKWIDYYGRHNWADDSAYDRAFLTGGKSGALPLGRSIPYYFDAVLRGLKPKYPDPLENMFVDVTGKLNFMEHEDALQTLEKNGQLIWDTREPVPGWKKYKSVTRPPQRDPNEPPVTDTKVGPKLIADDTGRPIEMANKIEGPEAQGKLGQEPPLYRREQGQIEGPEGQRQVGGPEAPPWYEQGKLEGPQPEGTAAAEDKNFRQIRRGATAEYAWGHPASTTTYNNWAGAGFNQWERGAVLLQNLQKASNASTALKLGLSGAHLYNIAQETMFSGLTQAFGEFSHGELARGLVDLGSSLTLFPRLLDVGMTGHEFQKAWTGRVADMTPIQQQIRSLFRDAGARPMSRGDEYMMGSARNMFTAWKDEGAWGLAQLEGYKGMAARAIAAPFGVAGQLVNHAADEFPNIISGYAPKGQVASIGNRIVATPFKMAMWGAGRMGDVATTLSAPLFDWAIPKIKYGSAYKELEMYIRQNPTASDQVLLGKARNIIDSMDDRFGELNQNNIFVSRTAKQIANSTLISTGWWYGTLRAFGRGMGDLATLQNTTRSRWLLGWLAGTAVIGNAYQAYMTGGAPRDIGDLALASMGQPRTGGTLPSGQDERAAFLNPWKELTDIYSGVFAARAQGGSVRSYLGVLPAYAMQKATPMVKAIYDFYNSEPGQNLANKMEDDLIPISMSYHKKQGSEIGSTQNWFGFRPGPRSINDPDTLATILNKQRARNEYNEQYKEFKQDQDLEEPEGVERPQFPDELRTYRDNARGSSRGRGSGGRRP